MTSCHRLRSVIVLLGATLLLQFPSCTYAGSPSDININALHCTLDCRNGGVCETLSLEDDAVDGSPESCSCPFGFYGIACEYPTEDCSEDPEGPCIQSMCNNMKDEDGKVRGQCLCNVPFKHSKFAGRMCLNPKITYCDATEGAKEAVNMHSYCTNGGKCLDYMEKNEVHPGCNCHSGFGGKYCEFFVGYLDSEAAEEEKREEEQDSVASFSYPLKDFIFNKMLWFVVGVIGIAIFWIVQRKIHESRMILHRALEASMATDDLCLDMEIDDFTHDDFGKSKYAISPPQRGKKKVYMNIDVDDCDGEFT